MNETAVQWLHYKNAEQLAHATVHRILVKAQEAISHRGMFKLVLAGGTTPQRVYELLAEHHQEWSKWQVFIGDERCLENNDPQRNSQMIKHSLLNKIDLPEQNFHVIEAQNGPEQGARDYAEVISRCLPFDLILLGIGEDGHTASLFPGHEYDETELTHAVYNAPKPPSERVTLSKKAISQSEDVIILVSGEAKKSAVQQWQEGVSLPVAQIQASRRVTVLIDNDAQP